MIHRSTVTRWLESHSRAETWPWNSPRRSWFLETVGKSNFLSSAIQTGHRVPQWDGFRGDNWPMTRWRLKMYVIHLYILCRKYESVFSKLKVSDFDEIFQFTGYMQEALQIQEIHLCWRPLPVIRIQIGALHIFSWGGVWQDKGPDWGSDLPKLYPGGRIRGNTWSLYWLFFDLTLGLHQCLQKSCCFQCLNGSSFAA